MKMFHWDPMEFLSLKLDRRWRFNSHVKGFWSRIDGAAVVLARLLRSLGGPVVRHRQLSKGVIRSIAIYGAPCWVDVLRAQNRRVLHAAKGTVELRVIPEYRTVSLVAAMVLAGSFPWELTVEVLRDMQVLSGHGCFEW